MSWDNRFVKVIRRVLKRLGLSLILYRLFAENRLTLKVWACALRYHRLCKAARSKPKDKKIRVLFIVSEIAKWKEQSLYKVMEASGEFYPMVGISAWNNQSKERITAKEYEQVQIRAEIFFDRLGDRHVRTVTIEDGQWVYHDLSEFKPDVVFYTEQWSPCSKQIPHDVSRYALTCFLPYYVPDFGITQIDCHSDVSRMVWTFFCLSNSWSNLYRRSLWYVSYAAKFVATGHPALDRFHYERDRPAKEGYVIYAPHFAFPHPHVWDRYIIGTFDWSGRAMLEYAEAHPEIKWVFKPHPMLRGKLMETRLMTAYEIEDYYLRWGKIAIVSTDADYQDIFLESRAMITDSGSFLPEYGSTGRPVIRLICSKNKHVPPKAAKRVYDTFYNVHNLDELWSALKLVVEDRQDPNAKIRRAAVRAARLAEEDASRNIVDYLLKTFGRNGANVAHTNDGQTSARDGVTGA